MIIIFSRFYPLIHTIHQDVANRGVFLYVRFSAMRTGVFVRCPHLLGNTDGEKYRMGKEKYGSQYAQFVSNRKKILATQSICAICGKPVDMSLKFPHPMSASVDHIIPWDKGGDCSIENLQLAHMCCNRKKSNKIFADAPKREQKKIGNQTLPLSADWATF